MRLLDDVNWLEVKVHYEKRYNIHKRLLKLINGGMIEPSVKLSLGISERDGNYSAHEHNLGPRILDKNANGTRRVYDFLQRSVTTNGKKIPLLLKTSNISYFKIGVGSESSCMVNPNECWVTNSRSLWAFLLNKHSGDYDRADEELSLYRQGDENSEMHYRIWTDLHLKMETFVLELFDLSLLNSIEVGVVAGDARYIWADAIANWLYAERHE